MCASSARTTDDSLRSLRERDAAACVADPRNTPGVRDGVGDDRLNGSTRADADLVGPARLAGPDVSRAVGSEKIFVARESIGMRNGLNGLAGLVIDVIEEDPQSEHLFVFFSRRRDR